MDKDDVVTIEDVEDVLNFHRRKVSETSHVERLAGTINYVIDKFLSRIIEEERK